MNHSSGHDGRTVARVIVLIVTLLAYTPSHHAQDVAASTAGQRAESLSAQLRDLADKEAALQTRLKQLDAELQPENIQNRTALTGTLDANALRDQLRRELEGQKAGVQQQLEALAASRARLQSSLAEAETEVVRRNAATLAPADTTANTSPTLARQASPAARPLPSVKAKRQAARRNGRRAAGARRRHR